MANRHEQALVDFARSWGMRPEHVATIYAMCRAVGYRKVSGVLIRLPTKVPLTERRLRYCCNVIRNLRRCGPTEARRRS